LAGGIRRRIEADERTYSQRVRLRYERARLPEVERIRFAPETRHAIQLGSTETPLPFVVVKAQVHFTHARLMQSRKRVRIVQRHFSSEAGHYALLKIVLT